MATGQASMTRTVVIITLMLEDDEPEQGSDKAERRTRGADIDEDDV